MRKDRVMRTAFVAIADQLYTLPRHGWRQSKPVQALKRALEEARQDAAGELRRSNAVGLRQAMDREYALMLEFIALVKQRRAQP